MFSIEKCPIPFDTMLGKYVVNGAYTDCYMTEISGQVHFPEFIFSFYTTPLFKLERSILKLNVAKPSTDVQARQLADGEINNFAAWQVENRSENEMLMCDFRGRTSSWLMAEPVSTLNTTRTRLYFGSAVVQIRNSRTTELSLGFGFQALLGLHQIYSILLLYSAKSRIIQQNKH